MKMSQLVYLKDVKLPLNDMRLDYVMGDWTRKSGRIAIPRDKEFQLIVVALKPFKYGMINTYIKLTFENEQGVAHHVELPVIGFVAPKHAMVS